MEILLNCVWLMLGLSLITIWSVRKYRTRAGKPTESLPSRRLQLTALMLLVILLFPVISLTDDLAMCTAPRDAGRAFRLHDPFDGAQPAPPLLPSTMAWMDSVALVLHLDSKQPVEQEASLTTQLEGMRRPVDSRPPPIAG